jgi:hypothetical protein
MSSFQTLLPAVAIQVLVAWGVVSLFVQTSDKVHPLKPFGAALAMTLLNLGVEAGLRPFLFQGTIVMQWALFVLLSHWLCKMPLGKSMLAQFCFFCLMLGAGMVEQNAEGDELEQEEQRLLKATSDQENQTPQPNSAWPEKIEAGILSHRLLEIRQDALAAVYGEPETSSPPDETHEIIVDTPAHTATQTGQSVGMTGAEFEKLVFSDFGTSTSAERLQVEPEDSKPEAPTTAERLPDLNPLETEGPAEVLKGDTGMTSEQSEELTEVKNRSTDRNYAPPAFDIGAVSIGSKGRFAMVDGRLLREGAVLRTGGLDPRGWKLHQVTQTELFWQPLK